MKAFNVLIGIFISVSSAMSFATECDSAKTARQMVKAIVAIEDIKGITSIYGGASVETPDVTIFNIEPHYQTTKDIYEVIVRNSDCHILQAKFVKENSPL